MATVLICLRGNVSLPGDRALSDRELRALLPGETVARRQLGEAWLGFVGQAATVGLAAAGAPEDGLLASLLATAAEAYVGRLGVQEIERLLRRATFVQQVLAVPSSMDSDEGAALAMLAQTRPQLSRWDGTRFASLGDQCAVELATLAAAPPVRPERAADAVTALFSTLLGAPANERQRAHAAALVHRPRAGGYLTHDLHVYKAKFFPRLARAALNLVLPLDEAPGRLLVDPFAGSGTALLEAARLGYPSLGIDLDPLSALISHGKLLIASGHVPPPIFTAGKPAPPSAEPPRGLISASPIIGDHSAAPPSETSHTAAQSSETFNSAAQPAKTSTHRGTGAGPEPFTLPHWLARKLPPAELGALQLEVDALQAEIAALPAGVERTTARLALSDALTRKLRMRFLGTGVGRFALEPARPSVTALYHRRREATARAIDLYHRVLAGAALGLKAPAASLIGDARALPLAAGAAAAVLTSPPYLPASSGRENYLRSKAPSLLALGLLDAASLEALDRRATGSMAAADVGAVSLSPAEQRLVAWLASDPLRAIKAEPCRRYFVALRDALREIQRVLRPDGRAAVVVGTRSTFYRFATREPLYEVDTADLLIDAAQACGLAIEERIDIELDKGNRNARPRSLDAYSETIVLLRRR